MSNSEELGQTGIRVRLQDLAGPAQVVALGSLASLRSEDGVFTTTEIATLFRDLRLPARSNLSATLGRLRSQGLVMQPERGSWALTPKGEFSASEQLSEASLRLLAGGLDGVDGADLGGQRQTLIPPMLAPIEAAAGLSRILDSSEFELNVMLITRFPKDEQDHFSVLIAKLREAVAAHGLVLQVASDSQTEDTLWANVVTYMWACKYAIVLVDSADGILNSNVLIEVGGMLTTGRRCAILRDESVAALPSDLVGHIYKKTDLSDHEATVDEVHAWIRDDLRLSSCDRCHVSSSGSRKPHEIP